MRGCLPAVVIALGGRIAAAAAGDAARTSSPAHPVSVDVTGWPQDIVASLSSFQCPVPRSLTEAELKQLHGFNCDKAKGANRDFQRDIGRVSSEIASRWAQRVDFAHFLCRQSNSAVDSYTAAWLAVNAWGAGIMGGAECCNLPHAPFCLAMEASMSSIAVGSLLAVFVLLCVGAAVASCLRWPAEAERHGLAGPAQNLDFGEMPKGVPEDESLYDELRHKWLTRHSLRALPESRAFASAAASTFAALQAAFDFQPDSVRSQFEHLLSLWRSHCSTVADRAVQEGLKADESELLLEALGDLHAELLEGFALWRSGLCACRGAGLAAEGSGARLPAALRAELRTGAVPAGAATQLAEVAVFLLIWGEAGNLRFMPEVLYLLTELALASEGASPADLYGAAAQVGRSGSAAPFSSSLFLAKIIRPMYNVVFDAWYDCVDVDTGSGRDIKRLRKGYETYLPPDAANYDDWNELFCDPDRLVQGLVTDDGRYLFDLPHERRFESLHRLDWAGSLDPYEVKTHREVHSMWAVFAPTHRIWLLHAILFCVGLCLITPAPNGGGSELLQGNSLAVRLAAIGLLVPVHGLLRSIAQWHITSRKALWWRCSLGAVARGLCWTAISAAPIATYAAVRLADYHGAADLSAVLPVTFTQALVVHYVVSSVGLLAQLLIPGAKADKLWDLTPVPVHKKVLRYLFWAVLLAVKMTVSLVIFRAVWEEMVALDTVKLGQEPLSEITRFWYSSSWAVNVVVWLVLWFMSAFLFVADTGVWYQAGCTFLGVASILARRQNFAVERAISKIPERFSRRVFTYSSSGGTMQHDERAENFSTFFPKMWDRIMESMHREDKCGWDLLREQSFGVHSSGTAVPSTGTGTPSDTRSIGSDFMMHQGAEEGDMATLSEEFVAKMPGMFNRNSLLRLATQGSFVTKQPSKANAEMQWRLNSFARCLGMNMPRPFRAPYIPGITVLIPHFQEDILASKAELYNGSENTVPLIDWIKARYSDEFDAFRARMQRHPAWVGSPGAASSGTPADGCEWASYTDQQWEMISLWASMRTQTLWRTVSGMCMYQSVLQSHYEAQADERSALSAPDVWDPLDCFTCLVSMQLYNGFSTKQLDQTNRMLDAFPSSLKVAYIDSAEKNITAEVDGVHSRQRRRYFSCLIDRDCQVLEDNRRAPRLRVELPGFPILGDGKSDNQNHAIPFMRGSFCQCIDSNQGAYLEQMLLLPCVLGEFRTRHRGESQSKRIIGLPEHITSDLGTVGDFAAGSELAFGTVLQRSHALLGARMHYGHPDIMNKQYMIQQGGVSKATKTLNLSEDIFAGMDFKLRGNGREIRHCEYFYLSKGRDLGFNAVMGFFSKLSSGTGEQILTRQMYRLGQILSLPESLSFYYAHAGYYITQCFIALSMPVVVTSWLMVLSADCEDSFRSFMNCGHASSGEAMAAMLSAWCSWVMVFFLIAQTMPLFVQVWMEMGLRSAIWRVAKQWLTGSWSFFIFQAKVVGFYTLNELRYGGAAYVSTGRGLPTQRSPFVGQLSADGSRVERVGGLYLDYAMLAYYDAMQLLFCAVFAAYLGGIAGPVAWFFVIATIFSWFYAPFMFNPYQFSKRHFKEDLRSWWAFFFKNGSSQWVDWYTRVQLMPRRGLCHAVWDITAFLSYFCLAVWFAIVDLKLHYFQNIFAPEVSRAPLAALALCPPIALPLVYCAAAALVERAAACCRCCRRAKKQSARQLGGDVCQLDAATSEGSARNAENEAAEDDASVEPKISGPPACSVPLPLSAALVVALVSAEMALPLYQLAAQGWQRAVVAGLILKFLIFRLVLFLAEGALRCRHVNTMGPFLRPLQLFVHSVQLARDIFVSAFIFWTLALGVVVHSLNEVLCPGCILHQLLIYRARPLRPTTDKEQIKL